MSEYAQLRSDGAGSGTGGGLAGDLGVTELSSFGVSSSAPMTVTAGAAVAIFALGAAGVPLYFLAAGVIAAIWSIGYVALSRRVQSAGAQATFIMRGLGKTAGVVAQGVALVAYSAIYVCLYGLFGARAAELAHSYLDWLPWGSGPWWLWAGLAAVGVGWLGSRHVKYAGRVLKVLLVAEIAAVVAIDFAGLLHPAGGHYNWSDLNPAAVARGGGAGAGGVLALVWACLIGFEETPGLAEEAKDPKRGPGRALLLVVGFLTLFYGLSFAAMSVGEGPNRVAAVATDPTADFPFNLLTGAYGSAGPAIAAKILLLTSVFAALAAFHTVCTRYVFAAGRDGVLPAALGRIAPRLGSPARASGAMTAVAVVIIAACALTRTDSFWGLFIWGSYVAAVGILALMIGSSFAVIGYFSHRPGDEGVLATAMAPLIAALLMFGCWLLVVFNAQTMIGAPRFGPLHLALLGAPFVGGLAGLVRAWVMRARPSADPLRWAQVGVTTPAEHRTLVAEEMPLSVKVPGYHRIPL